jgi:hypothetical protein
MCDNTSNAKAPIKKAIGKATRIGCRGCDLKLALLLMFAVL